MSGDQKTIINGNPSQYVKLNVGGHLFHTTIATLTAKPDTMLQAMFSGRMEVLTDTEGNSNCSNGFVVVVLLQSETKMKTTMSSSHAIYFVI